MNHLEVKQEYQHTVENFQISTTSSSPIPNHEQNVENLSETLKKEISESGCSDASSNSQQGSKAPKRLSASKKYWGQVMCAIGHFGLTKLQNSVSKLELALKARLTQYFTGKKGMEYKLPSQKKALKIIIVDPSDSFEEKSLKMALSSLIVEFFQDINYENWVLRQFKGIHENKLWYLVNKRAIMDRVLFGKKTHFSPPKSDRILTSGEQTDDFVMKDKIFENSEMKLEN